MKLLKLSYIIALAFVIISNMPSDSQEYIIFEKQKGFNKKVVLGDIFLSQNYVQSEFPDTIVDIYNYYFATNQYALPRLDSFDIEQQDSQLSRLSVDFLVSAVVAHKISEDIRTKVLSKDEVRKLNVFTEKQFLETFYAKAKHQVVSRKPGMPFNRTLEYKLIINDGGKYLLIDQPVIFTWYLVCATDWYFPNQFQAAVLNASPKFVKFYKRAELMKMDDETPYSLYKQFTDRVFVSKRTDINDFGYAIYDFWEFIHDEAILMVGNPRYRNYHPGLGTFSLLPKVGIIKCSLRSSLIEAHMPTDISNYKVLSINGVKPSEFSLLLKKYVYNKTIWDGH